MKLVDDWKQSYKWWSVWVAGIISAAPAAWLMLPSDLKMHVPDAWMPYIAAGMFAAFFLARVLDQK